MPAGRFKSNFESAKLYLSAFFLSSHRGRKRIDFAEFTSFNGVFSAGGIKDNSASTSIELVPIYNVHDVLVTNLDKQKGYVWIVPTILCFLYLLKMYAIMYRLSSSI